MEIKQIIERAIEIKKKYQELEVKKYGKIWTNSQIAQGFVGDVGDLMKIIMAKDGIRTMSDVDKKLEHELADCLYSIAVLSDRFNIDLEKAFLKNMDELESEISNDNASFCKYGENIQNNS